MTQPARFIVAFRAAAPDTVRVGDRLTFNGTGVIHHIDGELVDITAYGQEQEFMLGEVSIELEATSAHVKAI